jgi:hypothetical protein
MTAHKFIKVMLFALQACHCCKQKCLFVHAQTTILEINMMSPTLPGVEKAIFTNKIIVQLICVCAGPETKSHFQVCYELTCIPCPL